ncbi:MAG: alpha/beta fold hydrolase [Phycisphaerales bacterium]|nr:alpha/beta fold hydrolase [Phycisphaerales bacterium]
MVGDIIQIPTSDGGTVAVKRRPNRGGTPVVLFHGLAVNADLWNLPDIDGPNYRYRSLATVLVESGYDVWLVNFRGHGAPTMYSAPPPGQRDWCVDHFIAFDLPAVFERVAAESNRSPFAIGASMGAMTLAGYVLGAAMTDEGRGPHMVADPAIAAARQAALRGCAFIEFPAALRWPQPLIADGKLDWGGLLRNWRRTDPEVNYSFEVASRLGWAMAVVNLVGEVPLDFLRPSVGSMNWIEALPRRLSDLLSKAERGAVQAFLNFVGMYTGQTNHKADVFLQGRRHIVDGMKAGVLRQLAKSVRSCGFVSDIGEPVLVYSNHYDRIATPALVLAGSQDRIANPQVTREAFFERIASADKQFHLIDGVGHAEIETAPVACEKAYPLIVDWLKQHDAA